jgi:hypothetical protein
LHSICTILLLTDKICCVLFKIVSQDFWLPQSLEILKLESKFMLPASPTLSLHSRYSLAIFSPEAVYIFLLIAWPIFVMLQAWEFGGRISSGVFKFLSLPSLSFEALASCFVRTRSGPPLKASAWRLTFKLRRMIIICRCITSSPLHY